MRNILMTVMLLIVVVILFTTIIDKDSTGTKSMIKSKGESINTEIGTLVSPSKPTTP
ncbi:hypothetical protein MJA45_05160 [Paenibacillus aurantius]|uniref:Uncharacterized protein n=1 Tax=Paenibacillus aurantius TaxID=2918900 RepID=A0AA96LEQ5_9BACL|nr:hypothetical protein [Paenibacillus aurantius]WNQ12442.1 hypothetical protein MJA45_05160 [Paenibacillus aurantius]